jgi:hypothetical protein
MNSDLYTNFQGVLDEKLDFIQKEAFVKSVSAQVQREIDLLL